LEEVHYLYKITNKVNGKLYIGVTKNPKHRQLCHFRGYDPGRMISKAVDKYGEDNFTFEIICIGSKEYIYDLEPKAIILYNSNAEKGHGYNLCDGGLVNNQVNKGKSIKTRSDDKFIYVSGFWFPNRRTALKSLNWGAGTFNGRKIAGTLGDICINRKHGPQEFVYVTGFWFPSKKLALDKINITPNVYEARRKDGTLGNLTRLPRKSNSTVLAKPCYFKGFWFPSIFAAGLVFNMKPGTLRRRILRGYFEETNAVSEITAQRFSNKLLNNNEV
jgi:group I intron endonuclease